MTEYSENTLVQQTTADYQEQQLGLKTVYAYNNEDFGTESLLQAWASDGDARHN